MRILIFRPDAIGDSLLTFPVIRALREKYRDAHITLISNTAILPLAKAWGIADEVYDPSFFRLEQLYSDTGISQQFLKDQLQQADYTILWLWFRNTEEIVRRNMLNAGAKEVMVARTAASEGLRKHTTQHLAETVGLQDFDWKSIPPITKNSSEFCLYNPPVAIHPGCSTPERMWPVKSFAKIINRLLLLQYPVLLLAGPMDEEVLNEVQKRISPSPKPGMLTILKNIPLLEEAQRIRKCACYLGNDSGIAHLAALLNIPTIALFLPCYAPYTHPIGESVEVIQEDPLEKITVERVFESVQKHL